MLWLFRPATQQLRGAATRPHASATPAYLAARAANILSLRQVTLEAEARVSAVPLFTTGALDPLAAELAALITPQATTAISQGEPLTQLPALTLGRGVNVTAARAPYQVLRGDVGSVRRLRVTRGVCLPSDHAIHLICGSKDVIHSWAIPGLGVKIDCIPGYNAHRRVLFRWRGVYWGHCMEVCGRYHHWMPILVRIAHKDIFLSWCLAYLRLVHKAPLAGIATYVPASPVPGAFGHALTSLLPCYAPPLYC